MTYRLATSFVALSTALSTPAFAEISAADVLSNQQALYGSIGATLNGDLSGDQLTNPEILVTLPQNVASLQIKTDAVTMTENSDGTVTIIYPSPMKVTVAGAAPNEGGFSATATMTHDGYTVTASGDPGDISYVSGGQNIQVVIGDVIFDAVSEDLGDMRVDGSFSLSEWTGTTRVTEGNMVEYSATSEVGTSEADFVILLDNVSSQTNQITLPMTSEIQASLPVGGSDVMNLSAALRDGLSVVVQSKGEGNASTSVTELDGTILNTQTTATGSQNFDLTFNEDGLAMAGAATDFAMTMNDPLIFPADLEFGIAEISMNYDLPLNASAEPQDFRVATGMTGVTMGDLIWNLLDPSGQLSRDPAEISFDVTGMGTNGIDLLDIVAMSQLFGPPPIQIDEVTIENLYISAVGVEATARGAMTFDWTDFQTIPGIARPEGSVTVNLNGANGLMDKLVSMGLIPEGDLVMPRMMMGMFATPVGDDKLESVLEVNEQGHVLANGQRLR